MVRTLLRGEKGKNLKVDDNEDQLARESPDSLLMTSTPCTICGGGAYSADAAGTARVSQEHRCVPHRPAILLLEGAVDGFQVDDIPVHLLRR